MTDRWHYSYMQTYLASSVGKDCAQGKGFNDMFSDYCCCLSGSNETCFHAQLRLCYAWSRIAGQILELNCKAA